MNDNTSSQIVFDLIVNFYRSGQRTFNSAFVRESMVFHRYS